VSGTFIPIRASITRLFGRTYVSPRVGFYIPTGGYKKELELEAMFGVAPRVGYLFPMTRDTSIDFAAEWNYLFGDNNLQYVGVSFGIFFGGRRLPRQ